MSEGGNMNIKGTKTILVITLSTLLAACGGSGGESKMPDKESTSTPAPVVIPTPEPAPEPESNAGAFIEENGVIVVEMESTDYSDSHWHLKTDTSASGGQAIEWLGEDLFNEPGVGVINIQVKVTTVGTYRFDWATQIGEGNSTTEANDSWLKIHGNKFYAQRDTSIVCPKGLDAAENSCSGELPEGSGKLGWFKAYRAGGDVAQFTWSTKTSDRDPHDIYVDFNQPGIYTVQVSGRSKHHVIDRFIMTIDPLMHEAAKSFDESKRVGE